MAIHKDLALGVSMARVKKINLKIGSGSTTLEIGDLCADDFKNIERPKCSVKSCQACLNAILDVILGEEDSSSVA